MWVLGAALFAVAYVLVADQFAGLDPRLVWLRFAALLVPPLLAVSAVIRRRQVWTGCQWLFWATIALGVLTMAAGSIGSVAHEFLLGGRSPLIGWYAVFGLFGGVAPLFALLAQPHRGTRERAAATTAVDIAGIAVLSGFLYSNFVTGAEFSSPDQTVRLPVILLSGLQQTLVCAGLFLAAWLARSTAWSVVYRRLGFGLAIYAVGLAAGYVALWNGVYETGAAGDLAWVLPAFFVPWAAAAAPPSASDVVAEIAEPSTPSRPWLIFAALAMVPIIDQALRAALPPATGEGLDMIRDLSVAVTTVSVLPLLIARLAVERSEQRRATARLQVMADALESAPIGLFSLSRGWRLQTANRTLVDMLGYASADELRGTDIRTLFPSAEARQPFEEWLGNAEDDRKPLGSLEVQWEPPNGHAVTLQLNARVVDEGERDERIEVLALDVTERRRLEQEYRQAQKMEAIGLLAGGVAHDFNNQLTAILGYTDLLLEQIDADKPIHHDLQEVRTSAQSAAALTQQLLAFSRSQMLRLEVVNVNEVVRRVQRLLSRLLGERIRIDLRLDGQVDAIKADVTQLEQVIVNLAVNARDAMPEGGLLSIQSTNIQVSPERGMPGQAKAAPGPYVRLSVSDTGIGMDAETRERVFEPFFTTKEQGKGTGLGLATIYGIVKQLSGYIWVTSQPRRGTTFELYFPATVEAPAATQPARAKEGSSVGKETVLLVEDETSVRAFSAAVLSRHGYRVFEAGNAEEAFAAAGQGVKIDLVLSDVIMPDTNGPAMFSRLRRDHPTTKGLFMSGYTKQDLLATLDLGPRLRLLQKPFGPRELLRIVREVLDT